MSIFQNMFLRTKLNECFQYNPDNVFKRFEVIEFPTSFVGLSTTKLLDVEVDLYLSAYLKTMYDNRLLKFNDAREISASHRAYDISSVDSHTVAITFNPRSECISKVKHNKQFHNRLVFDLRLIQVDGIRCCNNEGHSEIGRYYICGEFEYCNITHSPTIVDFGDVIMNNKVTKYVRIRNESNLIAAKMQYVKETGFVVTPQKFTIPPNSSKRVSIAIKPTCLKIGKRLTFQIRNPHDIAEEIHSKDENFLIYGINLESNIIYHKNPKQVIVQSLHTITEKDPKYTYLNEEFTTHMKRKEIARKYLDISKSSHAKKADVERFCTGKDQCNYEILLDKKRIDPMFCKRVPENIDTYDLFDISFLPFVIDFGRVGLYTYGESDFTIKNNSKYDTVITLLQDNCVLYTADKSHCIRIKVKAYAETTVTIFCWGFVEGNYEGTFKYMIDNKYQRNHTYRLQVGNPTLMVIEKSLKFGMVTTESFVTSVPVRIHNNFNVSVDFYWDELHPDTPFVIIPSSGSIPRNSCKICDVMYVCKATKTKTHEVDLITNNDERKKVIPLELSVITRKLSIKFLQPAVIFKDIALNIETIERVKLENSSREIALFHVVEPLIPGFRIEPMCGTIRPKMVITFEIIVKISCILEFSFDIYVKINNKENVILPVSGNVVEPKLIIHPKYIYMARVPCNMVTYVPVTFQNISTLKTFVEVMDTGDDNIFNVYIALGNEKQRVYEFDIDGGHSKTVYIKVFDIFRREYEMFIPFKINGLLGPPNFNSWTTEIHHYIGEYEQCYENNPRVKLKTINKDITFCRMVGVITVPWIEFSIDKFEIEYISQTSNTIEFTITNVSKYYLYVTISTSKLAPNFTLDLSTEGNQSIINESNIKFELDRQREARLVLKFHPKGHGKFVSTALLYLDKNMTIPYYNLTFIGRRQTPALIPSTHRIVFPPCNVGQKISRIITLKLEKESDKDAFSYLLREETNLKVQFLNSKVFMDLGPAYTIVTVEIEVCCQISYARNLTLTFHHECGSGCEVEVSLCFTFCPLTLHTTYFMKATDNPYPYYPLITQTNLYEYLEECLKFLEKWMFQQGFRRDLYPVIPDTFHAISSALSSQAGGAKSKGINVSYLNFVRRIAGPLMKHIRKVSAQGHEESFKCVKEIHDTYKEILNLLKSRGADLWSLQAKFLLSYDQFAIYAENIPPNCNADIIWIKELLADVNLFNRLNKQSWIDFILQSYKVFVMDSCFFDCVCVSSQPRDTVKVLMDWYNQQIAIQHNTLRGKNKPVKVITNITTDLSDGIAIASTILNHCSFLSEHFSIFCEIDENDTEGGIINNACLIIEAMSLLRLYFPLNSVDFIKPNFIQMLFLSIHLYVVLPMFKPKDTIKFNPPLLRSSTRQVAIAPVSQESLIFNYMILNNSRNNFIVEKSPSSENGKKMYLSVKFIANFTDEETCILLVHGYNKTRIFDTYMIFLLHGHIGSLNPSRKCKVTGPLYRPNKVDVLVSSPFAMPASYRIYLTDIEPTIPVKFDEESKPKFYLRRLNQIDKDIHLSGTPKETGQEEQEQKLYLQLICLTTQIGNTWIWFRGDIGEFFIKVTTQPRWDLAIDTLQARVRTWPMDPCSCGEACECYRTTVLVIPHKNELMLKSLRYALLEHASDVMMQVYDRLIETPTGKIILGMLLTEGGTNMSEVHHILRPEVTYRISSRALLTRVDRVTLAQHTAAMLALPVTVPAHDKSEKYAVTFTSECGMDIRTYRILFIETSDG